MALNKKTYTVLNFCSSPCAVACRNESILIPGGSKRDPGRWNFDIDELSQINNTSKVFKIGLLWFEPEYADELYNELKIYDYKDILTDEQIEEIILHPTPDGLEKILTITNQMYFSRIYGIFTGMKNAGYNISFEMDRIMRARYKEFQNRKTETEIQYRDVKQEAYTAERKEIDDLKAQLEQLKALIGGVKSEDPVAVDTAFAVTPATVETTVTGESIVVEAEVKPKTTRTRKKAETK